MNLNDLCKSYNSERVCGGSQCRPEGLRDPPSFDLQGSSPVLGGQVCFSRVVKTVNSEHVPHLGGFYKCRGQTLCFSQGWMPEPIDTVTVGCICKNSLNSLSKS